jgi:uncharacterized membrane protein YsdA (DUF1294 family)
VKIRRRWQRFLAIALLGGSPAAAFQADLFQHHKKGERISGISNGDGSESAILPG